MKQLLQALNQIPEPIPISTACLYTNDPNQFAYCCCLCRQEVFRLYIPIFGKYVIPTCRCQAENHDRERDKRAQRAAKAQTNRVYKHNIMNAKLQQARMDNFIIRPGTETIYESCQEFIANYENEGQGILSFGVAGNGKSHLAASIHHHLDEQGYNCLFIDFSQLVLMVEDAKKYTSKIQMSELISAAIHCDLLTLDEIGVLPLTSDEYKNILFPIINGREGKKTNYTTNRDLNELRDWFAVDKYGHPLDTANRLIERIIGSTKIVKNSATSKRLEEALNRKG